MSTKPVIQNSIAAASAYEAAGKTSKGSKTSKTSYGSTIGTPELSESAAKYYEQLKKKYSNMDFILVSQDKKAEAQADAGKYANANKTVVLIDTDKIEKMASDEKYRKQYENIISGAATQINQLKTSLGNAAGSVKTYGMQVDDGGTATFFAVVDKSLAAQKQRIEKNAAKKQEEKKLSAKQEAERKKADKGGKAENADAIDGIQTEDTVTVTASSIDELLQKINDFLYGGTGNQVQTTQEKNVGQNFNFSI